MRRRTLLSTMSLSLIASTAGCTGLLPTDDTDETNCDGERVLEADETFESGDFAESTITAEAEQIIVFAVSRISGDADPTVTLTNPDGEVIADPSPDRNVEERVEAGQAGAYELTMTNDTEHDGTWDITVDMLPAGC